MAILGFGIIDKGRGLLLVERAATAHTIFIVVCHIQGFHDVLEVIVPQDFLRFIDFLLLDENQPRLLSLTLMIMPKPKLLLRLLDLLGVQFPKLAVDAVALSADRGVGMVRQQAVELISEMVCSVHIVSPILPAAEVPLNG